MDYFSSNEIRIRKAIETDRIQYGENSVNEGANHPVMKTAFITALYGKRCLYLAITGITKIPTYYAKDITKVF